MSEVGLRAEDGVAVISLNAPDRLNAVTIEMGREILARLEEAESDARVIILTGIGRAFCSGAKLTEGGFDMSDANRDAGKALEEAFNPVLKKMRECPRPIVSSLRGAVAGVGCGLALAGDILVASEAAYFYLSFAKVGLVPDGGSTYFLTRTLGRARAMELMLLAERLPAGEALRLGLINQVVPDALLEQETERIARRLAAGPASLSMIKDVAWRAMDSSFELQLEYERESQCLAGRTADFAEGVAAFREKRAPKFTGK